MIHYHGTPITPNSSALVALSGSHAFISFPRPDNLGMAIEVCQSFAVDNGAYSAWKSGKPITDWTRYYQWVAGIHNIPSFDFAVIPDVVDGTEEENDDLLREFPWGCTGVGAPVWHLHESLDRLEKLVCRYPRICLGSSGEFSTNGTNEWWGRINEAMQVVCNKDGLPSVKLHGLRMLDPSIFTKLPLASADSTNLARSVGIDSKWKGSYNPISKDSRAWVLRQRIEKEQSPTFWQKQPIQECLLEN
tara:strand:- start:149 stop:889 length:741 start_codon:yes stop_codon:yes gene_type:complete